MGIALDKNIDLSINNSSSILNRQDISFLNDNFSNHEFTVSGYNMIRQDRSFSGGGGFIIFILNSISYTVEKSYGHIILNVYL